MEQLEKGHRHSKKKYFEMERRRRDGTTDPQLPGDLATPFSRLRFLFFLFFF